MEVASDAVCSTEPSTAMFCFSPKVPRVPGESTGLAGCCGSSSGPPVRPGALCCCPAAPLRRNGEVHRLHRPGVAERHDHNFCSRRGRLAPEWVWLSEVVIRNALPVNCFVLLELLDVIELTKARDCNLAVLRRPFKATTIKA